MSTENTTPDEGSSLDDRARAAEEKERQLRAEEEANSQIAARLEEERAHPPGRLYRILRWLVSADNMD